MALKLECAAFKDGERIGDRHTCEGANVSPPLNWSGAPAETRSFLLLCEDPDAPGRSFPHWAAYNIPADRQGLPEGAGVSGAQGFDQAVNGFGKQAYGGPCPPRGHGTHHYHFRLHALKTARLKVAAGTSFRNLAEAARPHIIETAELIGTYSR